MILFISIVNILLAFKLAWDWYANNKKKRIINHFRSALIDGFLYLIAAYLSFDTLILISGWVILAIGFRWLMFDFLFNIINNDKWNHYGKSAKLDVWLTKLGKWHLTPKFGIIITGIILIILSFNL